MKEGGRELPPGKKENKPPALLHPKGELLVRGKSVARVVKREGRQDRGVGKGSQLRPRKVGTRRYTIVHVAMASTPHLEKKVEDLRH